MNRRYFAPLTALVLSVVACERVDTDRTPREDDGAAQETAAVAPRDTASAAAAPTPARTDDGARTTAALRAALDRLVRGAAGDSATWFSGETADIVRNVDVDESGRATVDFVDLRPIIPNASSSAGSEMLLAQLNATVFSVAGVESVEYRMAGSCELLGEWLQYGTCLRYDRPQ